MTDVPAIVEDLADFTVIATTPAAMIEAQKSLIAWAERKIATIKLESQEASEQLAIAVKRKWNTDAWRRQVAKYTQRVDFYEKVKAALEAGYYIVPPFPIDVFAIRTKRAGPKPKVSEHRFADRQQDAQVLPIGEGQYVSSTPTIESGSIMRMNSWRSSFRSNWLGPKFAMRHRQQSSSRSLIALACCRDGGRLIPWFADRSSFQANQAIIRWKTLVA